MRKSILAMFITALMMLTPVLPAFAAGSFGIAPAYDTPAGDMNGDGTVDSSDALMILRLAMGLI